MIEMQSWGRRAAAMAALICLLAAPAGQAAPKPGDPAPPVAGPTVDGKQVSIQDYRGKAGVVLNIYVNFCPICRREFPHLKRLAQEYAGKGVQVIAVSLESQKGQAQKWSKEFGIPFPVIYDKQQKVAQMFGLKATPLNVVIDRDGKIVRIMQGGDLQGLENSFRELSGGR
ncbi:MAG: TlpA family protein disulfide reductase [Armatimonadetes bacterium]|nr:TlpA family protein disulfide reductase [Armatimonadota bacterium]